MSQPEVLAPLVNVAAAVVAEKNENAKAKKRHFTIEKVLCDGQAIDYPAKKAIFKGQYAKGAVKKAVSRLDRTYGHKEFVLTIRETTRASDKKQTTYSGHTVPAENNATYTVKDKKTDEQRTIQRQRVPVCTKVVQEPAEPVVSSEEKPKRSRKPKEKSTEVKPQPTEQENKPQEKTEQKTEQKAQQKNIKKKRNPKKLLNNKLNFLYCPLI